jgi:hypothetical protein
MDRIGDLGARIETGGVLTMAKMTDTDYQTLAQEAVAEFRKMRDFGYSGELPLGETWALTISKSRDSGLLEQSNYDSIYEDMKKRFPRDVVSERFGHWAVGWVEQLAVHMLDKQGRVTKAGKAIIDWQQKLEDYPVADEEDYSERGFEATIENIMSEGRIDEKTASKVFSWLWENNQRAVEDRDDQGGYPSDEEIDQALIALGLKKPEEEPLRVPDPEGDAWRGFDSVALKDVGPVEAELVAPGLAIHRALSGEGWTLTHVSSGLAAMWSIPTLRQAYQIAQGIAGIADWTLPSSELTALPGLFARNGEVYRRVIKEV